MVSTILVSIEAAFFIVSLAITAVAIYVLRRARNSLSDESLRKTITWMINSSFLIAILSAGIAVNYLLSIFPEVGDFLQGVNYSTFLFILIWLTIICNIKAAIYIKEIGKMFGFKETKEKELGLEKFLDKLK